LYPIENHVFRRIVFVKELEKIWISTRITKLWEKKPVGA